MSRRNDLGARKVSLKTLVPPSDPVVTVDAVKNSLRLDASVTSDDALILSFIKAATTVIENLYGVRMLTQTVELSLDDIPFRKINEPLVAHGETQIGFGTTRPLSEVRIEDDLIDLLVNPVQSITSFTYFNDENTGVVWDSTNYYLDSSSKPSRLVRNYNQPWPVEIFRSASAIKIVLEAGFGDAAAVPEEMKMAVQQYAEFLYNNRGCSDAKSGLPMVVETLMLPWRKMRV